MTRTEKVFITAMGAVVLTYLVGASYIALHFILKYW